MQHASGVMTVAGFKLNYTVGYCTEKSVYGLNAGRIRKLLIHYKNFEACKYDKIWFKEPTDIIAYEAMERILEKYN